MIKAIPEKGLLYLVLRDAGYTRVEIGAIWRRLMARAGQALASTDEPSLV